MNPRSTRTIAALFFLSALFGCANAEGDPVCGEAASQVLDDDQAHISLGGEVAVCGENGVGFVGQQLNGAQILIGQEVLTELGVHYVVVDPSCRFVAYRAVADRFGTAVAGRLTAEQAGELNDFLALEEWDLLDPAYGWSVCDGPWNRFAWGDRRTDVVPFCPASPLPEPPEEFRHELKTLAPEVFSRLQAWGKSLCGAVRYTLVAQGPVSDRAFTNAPSWPLDAEPELLAVMLGERPAEFPVHVATGEDAAELRALRTRYLAGEIGRRVSDFIPIEQPDGSRFRLFVRDVVEFERDGEAYVPWADLAAPPAL